MRLELCESRLRWAWPALALMLTALLAVSCGSPTPTATPTPPPPTLPPPTPEVTPAPTVPTQAGMPLTQFTTDNFSGSGNCAKCHDRLADEAGNNVSIALQWRSTMMANSAKDPYWQAQVESEVKGAPDLRVGVEETCATCHMPMARWQAAADQTSAQVLEDQHGFLSPDNPYHDSAMDGVSCSLCHQIEAAKLGTPDSFTGGYTVDLAAKAPDRPEYGPFQNLTGAENMRTQVGYTPTYGEHTLTAAFCSTCHVLYTPILDADENVQGQFPEQAAYLEWQHSVYGGASAGVPCQSCHMPVAQGGVPLCSTPADLPSLSPFAQHIFAGGNAFMITMDALYTGELGLTASTEQSEFTLGQTLDMLHNRAGKVAITSAVASGSTLDVSLKVNALTGHKFPTGFPSRRLWIHLTVTDAAGQIAFESGKANADGTIEGNNADKDAATYEPHYDTITSADQVQIYEPIMHDLEGKVTYTLLRAASYAKDNRLLPNGFDKATAGQDYGVAGQAANDPNFAGGSDEIQYQVDVGSHTGPYLVRAELLYQSIAYQFANALSQEIGPLVERFSSYYQDAGKAPVLVSSAEATGQ